MSASTRLYLQLLLLFVTLVITAVYAGAGILFSKHTLLMVIVLSSGILRQLFTIHSELAPR